VSRSVAHRAGERSPENAIEGIPEKVTFLHAAAAFENVNGAFGKNPTSTANVLHSNRSKSYPKNRELFFGHCAGLCHFFGPCRRIRTVTPRVAECQI